MAKQNVRKKGSRGIWRRINKNPKRYKLWGVICEAYEIAKGNKFNGLPRLQKKVYPTQILYVKGSADGPLFQATEEEVTELREKARNAFYDVKNGIYTNRVKNLVEAFENFKIAGRTRGKNKFYNINLWKPEDL